ncbi:hypothetical protein LTR91_003859 [Friedmanniomyces endolithicus]|uniref:IBR domain-containing protein n=1 Tax=Friedmanniomyces endolithicus TaxID=329885 RepID=A0AAN6KYI1_9PEZI|nr:hypothetical protein LTS09_003268 [Friedmanniomyces endolithicus]KAK0281633.1 hypothetical protein LTR35_007313 [Friedmanniomyces endolithicus]KAK0297374.1 hypothetical protein LTS00_004096 [Friedmanniomyces endolithicus]KAK0315486.1 hypothetical protein LTR01_000785 [Friedmanniomyces endolithicus]KAK0323021.1 hypothetical protein LTR82_005950 [Friedmanniomyces endolithicus]
MSLSTLHTTTSDGPTAECSVCGDEQTVSTIAVVHGDAACHGCITEMFTLAIEDEGNYPPRWAEHRLDVADVSSAISTSVQEQFKVKSKEWDVKPVDRMYCQGRILKWAPGHRSEEILGRPYNRRTPEQARRPVRPVVMCDPAKVRPKDEEAIFVGLKRGKDYQICPSSRCGRKVELKDGCNHMHCYCGAQFCYICGKEATASSGHWQTTCPRYNQPDAQNALYDPHLDPRLQREQPQQDPRDMAPGVDADRARMFAVGRAILHNERVVGARR